MKAYWTLQRALFLLAVICFAVYGVAGAGWAFDPLEHAAAWLGFGAAFFAAGHLDSPS